MHTYAIIPPAPGTLLVAHPQLEDPHFSRTVVLIIAHDTSGTFGLVLNRPNAEAMPSFDSPLMPWWDVTAPPQMIFDGGPVDLNAIVCLTPDHSHESQVRSLDITWDDPAFFQSRIRIFQGYAGWTSGQLENEITMGGWYVVPALPEDVVTETPTQLWSDVLSRQDNELSSLADFPEDPRHN